MIVGISDGRLARVSLQIVRRDKHKQHYCGDSFLVSERSGKPVFDPSSSSINTHAISVV